jgi:hypothetical protein
LVKRTGEPALALDLRTAAAELRVLRAVILIAATADIDVSLLTIE